MAQTLQGDMLDPQILVEQVQGAFKGKNAFMGSALVAGGAVRVEGSMPKGGQEAIGKTIDIPYFGNIGRFVNNPDGNAVVPNKLAQMSEQAQVSRSSLAVETSVWAQGVGAVDDALGDPYEEGRRQAVEQATREMDRRIMDAAKATKLVRDNYSSGSPQTISHGMVVQARALWGDEQDSIVAMAVHSQVEADIAQLTDTQGRPLLIEQQTQGQESVKKFAGIPLLVSDRVPLDGSSMGSVTAAGTTPPTVTLSGEPKGPWDLRIEIVVGGSSDGTATFRFSVDGGNHWSATYTVPSGGGNIALDDLGPDAAGDPVIDSLVGVNGETGVTANFANGTYNADNVYTAKANLSVSTMIFQRDAAAFWYNRNRLGLQRDDDILADTNIIALHLYYAAHVYRRRRGGTRPGVIRLQHNVSNYQG